VAAAGTAAATVAVAPGEAAAEAEPAAEAKTATEAEAAPAGDSAAAAHAPEPPAASGDALPLASYDDLTVPSLRARLRTLTSAQVAQLADYERTHAARAEVIAMFERRIAKLEAETGS
jgi:predicted flap endonuclease-1-like 5' DNA nuclease